MPDYFQSGTDWQCSSGPTIPLQVELADVWPQGTGAMGEIGGGDKDVLADGDHPAFALGAKANRPNNLTGVVLKYTDANLVTLNVADKFCTKQYVANVLTYSGTSPYTFDSSLEFGDPVYVDDSDALSAGVTLSRSPLNSAGSANPLFGYIVYCQDDFLDTGVGGLHTAAGLPITVSGVALVETEVCVLHVNDSGQARALLTE